MHTGACLKCGLSRRTSYRHEHFSLFPAKQGGHHARFLLGSCPVIQAGRGDKALRAIQQEGPHGHQAGLWGDGEQPRRLAEVPPGLQIVQQVLCKVTQAAQNYTEQRHGPDVLTSRQQANAQARAGSTGTLVHWLCMDVSSPEDAGCACCDMERSLSPCPAASVSAASAAAASACTQCSTVSWASHSCTLILADDEQLEMQSAWHAQA